MAAGVEKSLLGRADPEGGVLPLRRLVAVYAAGCLLHVAHAVAFTDPRSLPTDWDTFLALEIAIRAPLWPLSLLARLLGLDLLPAL